MGGKRKENKQGAEMNGMEQKFKKEEGRKRCIHVKRAGELNIMRQKKKFKVRISKFKSSFVGNKMLLAQLVSVSCDELNM